MSWNKFCQVEVLLSAANLTLVSVLDLEAMCSEAADGGDDPESHRACSSLKEDSMGRCMAAIHCLPSYGCRRMDLDSLGLAPI